MMIDFICGPGCTPTSDAYIGKYCQCAGCRHVDGVCIDHSSGGGCAACEGNVTDCDLTDYDDEQEDLPKYE